MDVCSLQETKWPHGRSNIDVSGYRFFFLESKDRWHGLGFAVKNYLRDAVFSVEYEHERIAVLRLRLGTNSKNVLTVINVHAPTADVKYDADREAFYECLGNIYRKYRSDSLVFIAGDFNARLGKKDRKFECLGSYPLVSKIGNSSAEQLITLSEENNLFLCNTAFRHKAAHRETWMCPPREETRVSRKGKERNIYVSRRHQIDFIICRHSLAKTLTDCRAYWGYKFSSDHAIVVAKISAISFKSLRASWCCNKSKDVQAKQCVDRVLLASRPELQAELQSRLAGQLNKTSINKSLQERWNEGLQKIMSTAATVSGLEKKKRLNEEDEELNQLYAKLKKI